MLNLQEEAAKFSKPLQLVLVRGIPGSGKSTFVRAVAGTFFHKKVLLSHCEADMYFQRPDGIYDFNSRLLKNAHEYCFEGVEKAISHVLLNNALLSEKIEGVVFCSNTFTKKSELEKYLNHAQSLNVPVKIYRMMSEYESIHNVPADTIQRMKDRFEDIEGEILVDKYE